MATDHIVGIDLGTTNSLVAYMQGDSPIVIPGEDGLNLVPSVVALALDENEKNQVIVGNAARRYLIETPERAVYSIKRLMGRGLEDVQDELKLFPFQLADDLHRHSAFGKRREHSECHQTSGDASDGLSRNVDAEALRDEPAGQPAAEKTSDSRSKIRHPRRDANIFQTEMANFLKIGWQPQHIEPPDRIHQKTREQNAPGLS